MTDEGLPEWRDRVFPDGWPKEALPVARYTRADGTLVQIYDGYHDAWWLPSLGIVVARMGVEEVQIVPREQVLWVVVRA